MRPRSWTTWISRLLVPTAAVGLAAIIAALAIPTDPSPPRSTASAASISGTTPAADPEALPHSHAVAMTAEGDHVHDAAASVTDAAHVHPVAVGTAPTDTHDHDHSVPGGPATVPTGPIVSVDDPRLTPAQQQAARTLLVSSRATIASLPDRNALVAAGYVSAGDNSSGMSHWVKDAFTHDGREVDAGRIESFMVQNSTGRTVGAMYMLEPGRTMANVPDIAGQLTTWHVHDPICFSNTEIWHFVSFASKGACPAGSFVRVVPPMMHVWLEDQPCGPFVGTEGHGTTTCSTHTH